MTPCDATGGASLGRWLAPRDSDVTFDSTSARAGGRAPELPWSPVLARRPSSRAWDAGRLRLLLPALLFGACAHVAPGVTMDDPAAEGFSRWEWGAGPGAARPLFNSALGRDSGDPLARIGRMLLARRRLDDGAELSEALALLERRPDLPEARIAAAAVERLAGSSTVLDERILLALAGVDRDRADPVVAERLAEAQARLLVARGAFGAAADVRAAAGLVTTWSLVGPLSPWHFLDFDRPLEPEKDPSRRSYATPWGREAWRPIRLFNGWVPVGHDIAARRPAPGEDRAASPSGDVAYARAMVRAGDFGLRLRVESTASVKVFVDGRPVLVRDSFRRELGRACWAVVAAARGAHRLLVKAVAGDAPGGFRVYATPIDRAESVPSASDIVTALSTRAGPRIAALLAAEDALVDDPARALSLIDCATKGRARGRLSLSLSADVWPALGTLGEDEARGRSRRDLDALVSLDPRDGSARLRRAGLDLGLGRYDAAQMDLEALERPLASRAEVALARLWMMQDASALALPPLRRALAADPGDCAALELAESLYDRMGAFTRLDRTADALSRCPGGGEALAEVRARRLGPAPLVRYWRDRLDRSPGDPRAADRLADALVAAGRPEGAEDALRMRLAAWPEDVAAWRKLGAVCAGAGDSAGAKVAWRQALALDPADLPLRRALALIAGHDVLDGVLPDAAAALRGPVWTGPSRAPTATILDSGAAWVHADGSATERVRTVERVLDESGLTAAGELQLPAGGELLAFRTHKRDGRILDADATVRGEKRSISAAAVAVGDDLEIDYLLSEAAPRRGLGGAPASFYFQASDTSLQRSIYVVKSGAPLVLDAHRMDAPGPGAPPRATCATREARPGRGPGEAGEVPRRPAASREPIDPHPAGGRSVAPGLARRTGGEGDPAGAWKGMVTFERRDVPALADEPDSPPVPEYFPWVQAGRGDTLEDFGRSVADQIAPHLIADAGVRALAFAARRRAAAEAGRPPSQEDLARALWQIVSERIRGTGGSLSDDASVVVARGEGARLLPMKAALTALGIRARVVLASGPGASAEPRRFPRLSDWTDALLEIEPVGGPVSFLAPAVRYAPIGQVPPDLCGRPALAIPDAADERAPIRSFSFPPCEVDAAGAGAHRFDFVLDLRPDGSLVGEGRERLAGFEGAAAKAMLEDLDAVQRRQAVETALAAAFPGASLAGMKIAVSDGPGDEGPTIDLHYRFITSDFTRAEEEGPSGARRFSVPLRSFPVHIGDRFLQLAARNLPLAITSWQRSSFGLTLNLPKGAVLGPAPAKVDLSTPFGTYTREETRVGDRLQLHERLVVPPQRIAPGRYPDFAAFAEAVDGAQRERLVYTVKAGK